jgi:uncharacterized membrane protein
MFGELMGGWEIILIFAVVMILFTAKRLPSFAQSVREWSEKDRKTFTAFSFAVIFGALTSVALMLLLRRWLL